MELQDGLLLRIFISEKDKHEGMILSDWIVRKAKETGLTGATMFRGTQGFGAHHQIHSTRIIDLADNLPVVVEIVDTVDAIEKLLVLLDVAISEGVATTQPVIIRKYRLKKQ